MSCIQVHDVLKEIVHVVLYEDPQRYINSLIYSLPLLLVAQVAKQKYVGLVWGKEF